VTERELLGGAAILGLLIVTTCLAPLPAQENARQSSRNAFETIKGPRRSLKWQPRRPAEHRWTSAAHRQVAHQELVFDAQEVDALPSTVPPADAAARPPDAEGPEVPQLPDEPIADQPAADQPAPGNDPFESTIPMPAETAPPEGSEMNLELRPDVQADPLHKEQDETKRRAQEREESQIDCKQAARDLKRIQSINLNIKVTGRAGNDFPLECGASGEAFDGRCWAETIYTWKPSSLCHKPLYFEEEALERYGHSKGPFIQPVYSAGHFFVTLPILPYKMGVQTPHECEYALGYYRPGSCAPYFVYPIPISVRGALFQAGSVVGTAAVLP
jgi:hypothetical protein